MKVFCSSYQKLNFVRSKISAGAGAGLAFECMSLQELKGKFLPLCFSGTAAVENFACLELMKTAVARTLSEDSELMPSALTPGFRRYLLNLYRQIAVAGIPAQEFAARGQKEIGLILAAYKTLTAGHEPVDIKRGFLEGLKKIEPETVRAMGLDGLEVVLDNFPSREDFIFLCALADIGVKITLSLPFPERSEYSYLSRTLPDFNISFAPRHELDDIDFICNRNAADLTGAAPRKPACVSLLKASGPYREIEQTMRHIRRILDREGKDINPFDIAVGVPDITAVYQFVEDAARRYDIPVYVRRGMPLARVPFVQAFLSLLRLVEGDYNNEHLLDVLENPYLRRLWQSRDIGEDISHLRSIIEKEAILMGAANWLESGSQMARWVVKLCSSLRPEMTLGLYCRTLEDFVLKCGQETGDETQDDWRERDRRAREKFLTILSSIAANCNLVPEIDKNYSLSAFGELLESELERHMIRYYHGELTGVQVLEMSELAGCGFNHLFLLTLNDSVVPGRVGAEPVLDETVLKGLGLECAADGRAREIAAFFGAVYACRGHLYLSYQDSAFDGGERIASYLLDDIMSAFDFGDVPSYGADRMVQKIDECLTQEEFCLCAVAVSSSDDESRAALESVADRNRLAKILERCRRFEESLNESEELVVPELGREISMHLGQGTFEIGVTALSDLLRCPFLWYFRHRLGIEEYEPLSVLPDNRRLGNGLHKCLETIFASHSDSRRLPDFDDYSYVRSELKKAWAEEMVAPLGSDEKRFAHDFNRDVRAIANYLEQEKQSAEPYTVDGREKTISGLRLDVPGGTLCVRGRIDRFDRFESGRLRVVDYKRGGLKSNADKKTALALQLGFYLLWVRDNFMPGLSASELSDKLSAQGYSFKDKRAYELDELLDACFRSTVGDWLFVREPGLSGLMNPVFDGLRQGRLVKGRDAKCANCPFGPVCPASGGA